MDEKAKLELTQCTACGNPSSNTLTDIRVEIEDEDKPLIVSATFSDPQENPQPMCIRCVAITLGAIAAQLADQSESMESQTDQFVEKH